MSFKESIIIPLSLWERCKSSSILPETTPSVAENKKNTLHVESSPIDILKNPNLSADVKVAMYHRAKKRQKTTAGNISANQLATSGSQQIPRNVSEKPNPLLNTDHILNNLAEKERPFAGSILAIIRKYPDQLTWNNNGEIIIDGKTMPGTDIVKLFQYITKTLVITRQIDVPFGSEAFYKKLLDIGVPESWIRIRLPKRFSVRKKTIGKKVAGTPARKKQRKKKVLKPFEEDVYFSVDDYDVGDGDDDDDEDDGDYSLDTRDPHKLLAASTSPWTPFKSGVKS
jgi:hypothetical protein